MKDFNPPKVQVSEHQKEFRVTLLNTRKSSGIGMLLLILPCLFLSGVLLNHYLKIEFGIFTSVYLWITELDHQYGDKSWLNWLIRALLVTGPLAAILINMMSVTHIRYEKSVNELICSFRLRWQNWLVIGSCTIVFLTFGFYLIVENL